MNNKRAPILKAGICLLWALISNLADSFSGAGPVSVSIRAARHTSSLMAVKAVNIEIAQINNCFFILTC